MLTSAIPPRQLPKLALWNGIPAQDRTIVAVPAIMDTESHIASLFHDLEVRFLGNRDPHLHFALLSDFVDAQTHTTMRDNSWWNSRARRWRGSAEDVTRGKCSGRGGGSNR